ncbi:MAG: NTP transferase domain-containing protein [Candidatus Brockarchaeota archaeon]|nr:NTP transferase domain-containing protein [Candidatus Brockarchaeota archaeon]
MQLPVVIIAAGVASRLKPYSEEAPKCLMELEPGVTILDFILSRIRDINPSRVLIVTRPEFRSMLDKKVSGRAEFVETDMEDFGNLYSVSLALKRLGSEGFLLLMSDHIYEKTMIKAVSSSGGKAAFTICLDKKPSQTDAEEGLKIVLKEQGVAYTDKKALPRHGIDTGVILCGEKARTYVEKTIESLGPNATISDALNLASTDNEVDYVDVTGMLWKDIDTPEDLVRGREVYWQILRKENKTESGLVSTYLVKPVSTRVSTKFYRSLDGEPLVVTLVSLIVALAAGFLLASKEPLLGGLLVGLAILLSEVGSELVNLYGREKWRLQVSALLDRVSDLAIVTGFSLSLLSLGDNVFLLTILAVANIMLVSYAAQVLNNTDINARVLRKIPATRDALLFAVLFTSVISFQFYGLYYLAAAPFFYLVCSIALVIRTRKGEGRLGRAKRAPKPEVTVEKGEITKRIEILVSSSLKLALSLLFLHMVTPAVTDITLVTLDDLVLKSDHLMSALLLIISIYFGYRILMSLKFLIDMVTKRLVMLLRVSEFTLRHMLVDLLYILLAVTLWIYLPPQLRLVPYIGENLARLGALAIFVFFILIFYDVARLLYKTFGNLYRKIIERLTEKIQEGASNA